MDQEVESPLLVGLDGILGRGEESQGRRGGGGEECAGCNSCIPIGSCDESCTFSGYKKLAFPFLMKILVCLILIPRQLHTLLSSTSAIPVLNLFSTPYENPSGMPRKGI